MLEHATMSAFAALAALLDSRASVSTASNVEPAWVLAR